MEENQDVVETDVVEKPVETKKPATNKYTEPAIKDLLEAGLHFGHQTKRWNPKMKRYIFDKRNGIHIIDLAKSLVKLNESLAFIYDVVLSGKKVLFVGTKKQAQKVILDIAKESDQFHVTHRWLGGTLTNNTTIRKSVRRMRYIESITSEDSEVSLHKKEAASLKRELAKLKRNLDGVADMVELPGILFVTDINRDAIAVAEANKLNIPVVAIVDTNCNPDPVDFVIPGNDDAIRAIKLIAGTASETIKKASAEYAKIVAEQERKRLEQEKAEAEAKKKAKAEATAKRIEKEKATAEAKKAAATAKKAETEERKARQSAKSTKPDTDSKQDTPKEDETPAKKKTEQSDKKEKTPAKAEKKAEPKKKDPAKPKATEEKKTAKKDDAPVAKEKE